jgi:hypothetical protein
MAPFVVRRSERIDYRVPVTLFAARDDAEPVVARSLDVSEGGMRVLAPTPMPVGAVVHCELTLDGRSTLLEGRVAWLSQATMAALEAVSDDEPSQALGIGIRFETLTREESGALRKLISQATEGYMPAELELHGVRAPVAARAVPTPSGARISAALPWLKRGAPVGVRFVDGPDDVRGHIADALLRELPNGGRRLQIDVQAEPPARVRRDTQYGDALEFERARPLESGGAIDVEGVETQTTAVHARRPAEPTSFDGPRRRLPTWLALGLGAALGAGATAITLQRENQAQRPIVRLTQSEANAALQAGSLSATAGARAESSAPRAAAKPAPKPISAAQATGSLATQSAALTDIPAQVAAPASDAAPTLVNAHGVTTVRIPFRGTLEKMTSRIWADPYALAIDLPQGTTSLALGRHLISDPEGIVSLVRLQARDGALLVRLTLRKPITTHSVAIGGNLLELRVVANGPVAQ